jgi:hypothetical protein
MKHTATEIKKWDVSCGVTKHGITIWKPARALNYTCDSMIDRIKWAFGVLTGKYDALDWEDGDAARGE